MVYSIAWNEASPVGSATNANTIDTELQDLKKSIRERMNQLLDSSTLWETDAQDPKLLDVLALAGTPEVAVVTNAGSQTILTGVPLSAAWDIESLDTGTFHDNVTNNDRFTIVEAGYYRLTANLEIVSGANAGPIITAIQKNGVSIRIQTHDIPASDFTSIHIDTIVLAAAADFYTVNLSQTTGTSMTLTNGATISSFEIERINGTT